MTKSRLSFLDLADQVLTDATAHGVLHLYTEDETLNGRQIHIEGRTRITRTVFPGKGNTTAPRTACSYCVT